MTPRSRAIRFPFRFCEPAFFGGLLDDPLLFLRIRPLHGALLFDCGQIAHLAKRVIKPIRALFVTHAHMDHLMGLPTLVRHQHASPRPLDLYGPAGIVERVAHLLAGFDWNLAEPTWFTLRVHEVQADRIRSVHFLGPEGFRRSSAGDRPRRDDEIWSCPYVRVTAEILDHKLPVLAFRIDECPGFSIDPARLEEQGLVAGTWIGELKDRILTGRPPGELTVTRREGALIVEERAAPCRLYECIRTRTEVASLGYVSDVGWTPHNLEKMRQFFAGVTLLASECTFLAADEEKARASHHLTTRDLNRLLKLLAPRYLVAMHLSKGYLRRTGELYAELRPPAATTVLRLPDHIVPAPLTVEQVKGKLHEPRFD